MAEQLGFEILKKVMQNPQLIELTRQQLKLTLEHGYPHLAQRIRELKATIHHVQQEKEKCLKAFYADAIALEQLKAENQRLLREEQRARQELALTEAKLHGAEAFQGKLDQVFALLQEFEAVWAKMTPVQRRIVYRGVFNSLWIEGTPRSRHFKVGDCDLKEPFKSWYEGKAWGGKIVLTDDGLVAVTDNEDKELCQSYGFAPTDVR